MTREALKALMMYSTFDKDEMRDINREMVDKPFSEEEFEASWKLRRDVATRVRQ